VFCTLEEVADKLGMHREQVRIVEQRALRKCLAYCEARGLRLEDLLAA
jgi:DNA-directed RNA polymerase sigma subunit (sigma70/sigma32)